MPFMPSSKHDVAAAIRNEVTVQEALEPLFVKLEVEADARLIRAAVDAGWTPQEAIDAIDDLRSQDAPASRH
jgi:hypothetical protein